MKYSFFSRETVRVHYAPYFAKTSSFLSFFVGTAPCVGFVSGAGYVRENTVGGTMWYYHRRGPLWSTRKDVSDPT